MLLVHGGGGKAFPEWAKLWAERGYVALAIDTAGQGADGKRHADAGPDQGDDSKFRDFGDGSERDMWTYHAVAAVIRGHSLLAAQPEVDKQRIGITGISWGGYLTSIITGLDDRLKVSVPVYGCGHLAENSFWLPRFEKMTPEQRQRWTGFFDPQQYLPGVRCPILFVNGTNDFAYPLDSYQKSYRDVPGRVDLCVTVGMPHGHVQGWAPKEIGLYVDSVLKGGAPLAKLAPLEVAGDKATARFESVAKIAKAQLHWTHDSGPWQKRAWKSADATLEAGSLTASVPAERPIVYFATITDDRGATVSTPHIEAK
jgi:dienelactone hydrolase